MGSRLGPKGWLLKDSLAESQDAPRKTDVRGRRFWLKAIAFLLKERPDFLYANSIELQPFTTLNQIIFGQKNWLDLLENDEANLNANRRRSGWQLYTYLWITRLMTKLLPWNNFVTVAEECFYHEIKFGKLCPTLFTHEIVPLPAIPNVPRAGLPLVLVTGTLGRHYGTLEALEWSARMQAIFPHILSMAGPAPDPAFAAQLQKAVEGQAQIALDLFEDYRPQKDILQRMTASSYLLMPYHLSPATRDRIPTKFHEAATAGITLIFPDNPPWERWCRARGVAYRLLDAFGAVPPANGRVGLASDWG